MEKVDYSQDQFQKLPRYAYPEIRYLEVKHPDTGETERQEGYYGLLTQR